MTFKRWAKIFHICGWANYGVAMFNLLVIGLAFACGIQIPLMNIVVVIFCGAVGWISFNMEDRSLEISEYLKEK